MSNSYSNQKQSSGNFRKLLQERIEKNNPCRELTAEETKHLNKLKVIADKLKRWENVQNRHLQTWLNEDKHLQIEIEWQEQLEQLEELIYKPTNLKRYEEKLKL